MLAFLYDLHQRKHCWLKAVEILEYFNEENHVLEELAEEKTGWQSSHQPRRAMQGLFYLTQQQLSGFAVAFPPDSICNSDRLWLLHVVTKHRDPGCGNRQELGTGQSSDLLPPMPRDTKKGWPAFTEELPPTTRQQEHFSQDTSQKINGSTIIN